MRELRTVRAHAVGVQLTHCSPLVLTDCTSDATLPVRVLGNCHTGLESVHGLVGLVRARAPRATPTPSHSATCVSQHCPASRAASPSLQPLVFDKQIFKQVKPLTLMCCWRSLLVASSIGVFILGAIAVKAAPTPLPSNTVLRTNSESKLRCPEQSEVYNFNPFNIVRGFCEKDGAYCQVVVGLGQWNRSPKLYRNTVLDFTGSRALSVSALDNNRDRSLLAGTPPLHNPRSDCRSTTITASTTCQTATNAWKWCAKNRIPYA